MLGLRCILRIASWNREEANNEASQPRLANFTGCAARWIQFHETGETLDTVECQQTQCNPWLVEFKRPGYSLHTFGQGATSTQGSRYVNGPVNLYQLSGANRLVDHTTWTFGIYHIENISEDGLAGGQTYSFDCMFQPTIVLRGRRWENVDINFLPTQYADDATTRFETMATYRKRIAKWKAEGRYPLSKGDKRALIRKSSGRVFT